MERGSNLERIMLQRLEAAFSPRILKVRNCSHLHEGHLPVEQATGQTHFSVTIVADALEELPLVARHRKINSLLSDLFKDHGLHALTLSFSTERKRRVST